jgi:4'-phosphopantetheinyl transferase
MNAQTIIACAPAPEVGSAVEVWTVPLDVAPARVEALASLLSREEMERAECFQLTLHRLRFIAAHAALRTILGQQLRCAPAQVEFAATDAKPRLRQRTCLSFSLSHSADFAMVAIAENRGIGIDLERITTELDVLDLARRFFAATEALHLASLPQQQRRTVFFEMWVRKEAWLKATGSGIADLACASPENTGGFVIQQLRAPAGYVAALAVENSIRPFTLQQSHLQADEQQQP